MCNRESARIFFEDRLGELSGDELREFLYKYGLRRVESDRVMLEDVLSDLVFLKFVDEGYYYVLGGEDLFKFFVLEGFAQNS